MTCTIGGGRTAEFPAGLRVLVVDDDVICLRVLDQMLRKCSYTVTSCSQAKVAINLLRERKDCFDIVLSDVHMPDMDGFRLLELVGLEMDLPVIMMSADGRTDLVMRGIEHGACDYLIKPVRDEELKNIWQHVVRKRWNETKDHRRGYYSSGAADGHEGRKCVADDVDCSPSADEGPGDDEALKAHKKRRETNDQEDDSDVENDHEESVTCKKPRVVWSVELHQQFVCAVNHLGIDKAVPKRILELMNVPGLTRENIASHLQKFRSYLKRLSGSYNQNLDPDASLGQFDVQLPPEALSLFHNELLSRTKGSFVLLPATADDQLNLLLHPSVQRSKSSFDNTLISFAQQQQQQEQQRHWGQRPQKQPGILEPIRAAINVQPSCLVVPSGGNSMSSSFPASSGHGNLGFRNNHGNPQEDIGCQQVLGFPSTRFSGIF